MEVFLALHPTNYKDSVAFVENELLWGVGHKLGKNPQLRYQYELNVRFNVVHQKNILKATAKRLWKNKS